MTFEIGIMNHWIVKYVEMKCGKAGDVKSEMLKRGKADKWNAEKPESWEMKCWEWKVEKWKVENERLKMNSEFWIMNHDNSKYDF